jgi:uncharacterized membrane protein YbhN (UPF0104 family)
MKEKLKTLGKPLAGLLLVCAIIYQLDMQRLLDITYGINYGLLGLGLVSLIVSNIICAMRWRIIAEKLDIKISRSVAVMTYAQGIAANTVLPGGILSGDLWRSSILVTQGAANSKALISVLLDRLSGLWMLSIYSVVALLLVTLLNIWPRNIEMVWITLYGLFVFLLLLAPCLYFFVKPQITSIIFTTAHLSSLIQFFALSAFYLCVYAVNPKFSGIGLVAVSTGIFVAATFPFAIGGFGPREVGALVFLSALGISNEEGFLASILYGLLGTFIGLLSTYFWILRPKVDREK